MHIHLLKWDFDSFRIKLFLHAFEKIELHRPEVGVFAPGARGDGNRGGGVLTDANKGGGIFQNQRMRIANFGYDRLRFLKIGGV